MANGNIGNAHIAFTVDELEPLYERLTAARRAERIGAGHADHRAEQGGRAVYMIDPDGFRVELIETSRILRRFRATE